MRAALLITLVAFGSFAQGRFDRFNARTSQGRSTRGFEQSSYAFFEFAPASGAGMGTACACTTPTGAKGETMTYVRAGNATCSKQGLATTGIANGDLVVCTANQPRVESSGGVLGLRVESARTNSVLRSQELDNAAWADDSSPVSPITITANAATAPDGTLTAERFQIPSRTAAQWSLRYQAVATGVSGSTSVYVKGNGQSGVFSIAHGASLSFCVDCAFDASTWTRCELGSVTGGYIWLGTVSGSGSCAGGTKPAVDAFIWGAQTEGAGVATYATSYIPTVAAGVTRNADDAYFDLSTFTLGNLSLAATAQTPSTTPVRRLHGALTKAPDDGSNFIATYQDTVVLFGQFTSTAGSSTWNTGLATTTGPVRAASFVNGANVGACINSTCATNPIGTFNPAQITNPRRLRIGAYSTTNGNIDGIQTLTCLEPDSPTRCR